MDLGERSGNRAVGIGEAPYFDPMSTSRNEALGKTKASNGEAVDGHGNGTSQNGHGMNHGMGHGMGHGMSNGMGQGMNVKEQGCNAGN